MSSTAGAAASTSAASASGSASRPSLKRIQNSRLGSPSGRPSAQPGSSRRAVLDLLGDAHAGQPAAVEQVRRLVGRRERRRLVEHERAPVAAAEVAEGGHHADDLAAVLDQARLAGRHAAAGPHDLGPRPRRVDDAGPQEVRRGHERVGVRHVGLQRSQRHREHVAAVGRAVEPGPAVGQRARCRRGHPSARPRCRRRTRGRSWSSSPDQRGRRGQAWQLPVR